MKKLLLFITTILFISCSSDDAITVNTNYCNQEVITYYANDFQHLRNVKNNAIIIEFDFNLSDTKITKILQDLNLFKLPLNNEGVLSSIVTDPTSTHLKKVVVAYFTAGSLSCEQLSTYIEQIKNINEVYFVRKAFDGVSSRYSITKETNIVEVKLNNENEFSNLESIATQHDFIVFDYNPVWNTYQEDLIYYLIDDSEKKSVIEMAKILSETISYEYISPQLVTFQ